LTLSYDVPADVSVRTHDQDLHRFISLLKAAAGADERELFFSARV